MSRDFGVWRLRARAALRIVWMIHDNVCCLLFFVITMLLLKPVAFIAPRFYWKLDEIFTSICFYGLSYQMHSAVNEIVIYGEPLEQYVNEPCLVVVNHQSDADPIVAFVALRLLENLRGRLSVVLEDIFRYTNFGIMMRLRGDFFIHQGRDQRHLQASMIQETIRRYEKARDPRWCLLFPEGGFLRKRKQRNIEYAEKNGYPVLENVLLPRLGASKALLSARSGGEYKNHGVANGNASHCGKPYFRHVIDMTIAYPQGKPATLLDMILALSPLPRIAIHFRAKSVDRLSAADDNELRTFMYDLWSEKERLLQGYYDTGSFPDKRYEDKLDIDYLTYMKAYLVVVPCLAFYAYCFLSLSQCLMRSFGVLSSLF